MHEESVGPGSGVVVEWAPFELADGKDEAELLSASAAFQAAFLEARPGFQRRELLHQAGSRQWVDLVYWESAEAAARAFEAVEKSEACALYFSFMKLPDTNDLHAGVQHFERAASYAAREGVVL